MRLLGHPRKPQNYQYMTLCVVQLIEAGGLRFIYTNVHKPAAPFKI
jgi:hypothetical protein